MADTNKWRIAAKEKGLCIRCGKPRNREGVYCALCLEKERERHKKDKEFFVDMGICYMCRKTKLFGDEKICPECLAKNYEQQQKIDPAKVKARNKAYASRRKEIRQEYNDKGICYDCKKRKIEFGKKRCRLCLNKDALAHRKKHIPIREIGMKNGLCYQCVKENATNGKLCKSCYDKAIANLERGRNQSEYYMNHKLIMQGVLH